MFAHLRVKNWPFDVLALEISESLQKKSGVLRILDIGAGSGHYWLNAPLLDLTLNNRVELNFLDAHGKINKTHNNQIKFINKFVGIAPGALSQFSDSEFDIVLAFDLIEHLTKTDGYILLYEMDRISGNKKIILTPNGWVWQPPSSNNKFNAHLSGWRVKDFKGAGYRKIRGMLGAKFLLGPYAIPKKNKFIFDALVWKIFSTLTLSLIHI